MGWNFGLNNIEQDHRFIKKWIAASVGFRSAEGAWRTIEGYEAMHAILKGQVRWVAKGDPIARREFIHSILVSLRSSSLADAHPSAPLRYFATEPLVAPY